MPGHLYLDHTLTPCCVCRNSRYTSLITKPVRFLNYLIQYWSGFELFKAICKRFSVIYMQRLLRTLLNRLKLPEHNISYPCSIALTWGWNETKYCCPTASCFTLKFTATVINKWKGFNLPHLKLLKTWQGKAASTLGYGISGEWKSRRFISSSWCCEQAGRTWGQIVFQNVLISFSVEVRNEQAMSIMNLVVFQDILRVKNITWVYLRSSFSC